MQDMNGLLAWVEDDLIRSSPLVQLALYGSKLRQSRLVGCACAFVKGECSPGVQIVSEHGLLEALANQGAPSIAKESVPQRRAKDRPLKDAVCEHFGSRGSAAQNDL